MKNRNIILVLIIILIGLAIWLGIGFYRGWDTFDGDLTAPLVADHDSKTYKNDKYGFELTLTDSWKGITVEEDNSSLEFFLPTTGQGWVGVWTKAPIFTMFATPLKEWQEESSIEIARNDKYVFSYIGHQDYPDDLQMALKDRNQIISSFKFNNQTSTAGWKTYTDKENKFSFLYPSDRTSRIEKFNVGENINGYDIILENLTITKTNSINLKVEKVPSSEFEAYLKPLLACPPGGECSSENLDGVTANVYSVNGQEQIAFGKDGIIFLFYNTRSTSSEDKTLLEQVASSFKFNK